MMGKDKGLCAPMSALGDSGETGEAIAPEPGDTVSMTVEGTLDRVEGGLAYITPTLVNGEPIPEKKAEPTEEDSLAAESDELEEELRGMGSGALA